MSISVQNISKSYGSQLVLNEVSFNAKKGEIIGFLGPNGAGKSTTMKIITGFLAADKGQVFITDEEVHLNSTITKSKIGYLPEQNPLYLDMYVQEYLEFQAKLKKESKASIPVVIEKVGLTEEKHKKIGQLSKGYQQRVGLAAAILHNPEVLILDEPTTGLDPNQLREIRSLIKMLGKEKTILLSTHIMQEVEAICDRVIIINKGEILFDKPLHELKTKSLETLFEEITSS